MELQVLTSTARRQRSQSWLSPGVLAAMFGGVLFLGWLAMSRPEDRVYSSNGFNLRGAAAVPAREASMISFTAAPRPPRTSLTLPAPIEIAGGPAAQAQPAAQAEPEEKRVPKYADAGEADATPEATPQEAQAAGVPASPAGLQAAGAQPGMFDRLLIKAAGHPRGVKFVLNNKLFNDALYRNPWTSKACNDKGFLQSYLANGSDPNGVSREIGVLKAVLGNPESARAAANTTFMNKLLTCPATKAVAGDPQAVLAIAKGSPQMLPLTMHPMLLEALGSNPNAADSMLSIQSALESHAPSR